LMLSEQVLSLIVFLLLIAMFNLLPCLVHISTHTCLPTGKKKRRSFILVLRKVHKKIFLRPRYKAKIRREKATKLRNFEEYHRRQFLSTCIPCSVDQPIGNCHSNKDQVEKRALLSGTLFHFLDPVTAQWGTMRFTISETVWEIKEKIAARGIPEW
jgi:hypothetical protein